MTFKTNVKRLALVCAVAAALSLTGCKKDEPRPQMPPPAVKVVSIEMSSPVISSDLSGRTSAYRVAEVRPQVAGIVMERSFQEGQEVKEGEQLYQIDPAVYQAQYKQAHSNLKLAQTEAKRAQRLLAVKATSQQVYDQAQAQLEAAKAAFINAKTNLEYTKVQSPISGRVGRSEVTPGALVSAYQTVALTTVQQLDPMYVDIRQSASDMLRLKKEVSDGTIQADPKGFKIKVILEDGTEYAHTGLLTFTGETVDAGTGMVNLRAEIPNPNKQLLPGMFVRVKLQEGTRADSILLDQRCVMRDPRGNAYVFVVGADNKVQRRDIVAKRTIGTSWLVESGLTAGEKVIVEGLQKVRDGATVRLQAEKQAEQQAGKQA